MAEYKSIRLPIEGDVEDEVLTLVQDCLCRQPEPRPYLTRDAAGYVFHFHTLDLRLLREEAEELTAKTLFTHSSPESREAARQILEIILDEVGRIGSYGIKSGRRQYVGFNAERKVRGGKPKSEIALSTITLKTTTSQTRTIPFLRN